jgi:hypothetical protein
MKQSILEPTKKVPTANLAVNRSRIKIYNKQGEMPTYYLQNGTEFQIELFNPTTDVVLAKITLNGNPISQGGLVLNPGQRVFLERYLDIAKKFLFDTYEVSNTKEVQKAIENNGDFKVEFFKEKISYYNPFILTTNGTGTIYGGPNQINQGILRGSSAGGYVGQTTTNINNTFTSNSANSTSTLGLTGMITNTSTLTSGSIPTTNAFFNQSASNTGAVTMDSLYDAGVTYSQRKEPIKRSKTLKSKSIETGRVEKGSSSDQKIKTIDKEFEYFSFHTIEYKMLPISQKINTTEDINIKVYCTNCGAKLGKGHKFCSSCGTKA